MSTVYNPFRDMDRVFTQLAHLPPTEARTMPMDLYRDGDEFVVKIDLPGVDPDSIDIDVDDRTLSVRAERERGRFTPTMRIIAGLAVSAATVRMLASSPWARA